MSNSPEVTPAQEIVTMAILGALLMCTFATYMLIAQLNITSLTGYITLIIGTSVTSRYIVPNLVAHWLGRPLDEIFNDETAMEASIDPERSSD